MTDNTSTLADYERRKKFYAIKLRWNKLNGFIIIFLDESFLAEFENCGEPRKRNFLWTANLPEETEILLSLRQSVTSRTGGTTFVECSSPWQQCQIFDEQSEARLRPPGFKELKTVPAVQREVKQHTADNSLVRFTVSAELSCGFDRLKQPKCVSTFITGLHTVLDYLAIDSISLVDYNNEDYVFEKLPVTFTLVTTDVCFDFVNMATCLEDPRSVSRMVRTEGKNISKLKKLFDSSERIASNKIVRVKEDRTTAVSPSENVPDHHSSSSPKANHSDGFVNQNNVSTPNSTLNEATLSEELNNVQDNFNGQNSPPKQSDIQFCRQIQKGALWENVDIGVTDNKQGLWNTNVNSSYTNSSHSAYNTSCSSTSTEELHNLIATSRTELSKIRDHSVSDKSNLENYFTSFEHAKMKVDDSNFSNYPFGGDQQFFSTYDCDIGNMVFDDEEGALSDVSSDEEMRNQPPLANVNYLPAYALHTIIEESCEESEKDSRTTTPTNNAETSKLERYFSWDIINDAETRKKEDDESTIYSDSLSEASVDDSCKDSDPTQLVTSRLEKYFTSGLVDEHNCFYPEDAEFSEDLPISDFEEDSMHQKISRSALLSSLETKPVNEYLSLNTDTTALVIPQTSTIDVPSPPSLFADDSKEIESTSSIEKSDKKLMNSCDNANSLSIKEDDFKIAEGDNDNANVISKSDELNNQNSISENLCQNTISSDIVLNENITASLPSSELSKSDPSSEQFLTRDTIASDIQSIIQKLVLHFSVEHSDSFKGNMESSAWQMLESEIDRLLNSISPTALEHYNCNNSIVDSNNSDYGSDTIESIDCMTDDDENTDAKGHLNSKCPLVDIFKPYKLQSDCDLSDFNISDETLAIWKRLIQSLQRDNVALAKNIGCDPSAEARLFIKNQIVTLMHTVTVNDNISEVDKANESFFSSQKNSSVVEPDDVNEAFNVNVSNVEDNWSLNETPPSKTESSDEGVYSTDSNENIHSAVKKHVRVTNAISEEIILKESFTETASQSDFQESPSQISSEIELPTNTPESSKKSEFSDKKFCPREAGLKFSVIDIELEESVQENALIPSAENDNLNKEPSIQNSGSVDSILEDTDSPNETLNTLKREHEFSLSRKVHNRDIGYFSYKSCDDSLLDTSNVSPELDVPNFKSLKRSIKKFPLPSSSTLSKSTNNINQSLSIPDTKFSTLQLKPKKSKTSSQFSALFSPSSVFKRITGSKASESPTTGSAIPAKYLKKYARSTPVENESLFGAVSMPHLNSCKPGDSYSALGLYSENDPDNSLVVDDEIDAKRYFSGSQSALSLGTHSASMISVYSAGGCHYNYINVSGDVLFGLNYNQKSQMMEVFVKQCRNLAAIDVKNNKSSPYVKVYLLPDKTRSGKRKTKTKKNTLNPVFNDLLRFPVLKNELESRTLWLSVWNSDLFGRNDFLGEISLPLGYRLLDSPTLRWYPLQERSESLTSPLNYRGELFIALKYVPRDLSLESRFRPAPVISVRGALHILVKEARNISTNKNSGALDAFCKSYLLPDKSKSSKQKTPVVRRSRHPKWYYTVIYEDLSVDDLKERSLELTIWDHDKISSNHFLGGVRLNTASGLYHGVPVEWMDARRDESSLWQAMLQSPNMWVDGCLPLRPTLQSHHS